MGTPNSPHYCAYLLRCWTDHCSPSDHSPVWRFSLENPHTGARHGFASFEALVTFLAAQVGTEPPGTHDNPTSDTKSG